jgi:hypothetical protein
VNPIVVLIIAAGVAAAQSPVDGFDGTVDALRRGIAAQQHHDAKGVAQAARILAAVGAHNEEGTPAFVAEGTTSTMRQGTVPPPFRNRALGPGYRLIDLPSGGSARFDQTFLAGQSARVAVVPLGRGGFGLAVQDEDGPVCAITNNPSFCNWIPVATSRVRIEITNRSTAKASFYLVVR